MRKTYFAIACLVLSSACTDGDGDGSGGGAGGGGGGGGGGETLTCPELVDCIDACSTEDCTDGCIDAASDAAALALADVLDCIDLSACADDDEGCIEASCGDAIDACYGAVGAGDDFPDRIEGTSRDYTAFPGTTQTVDSNATLEFVRDDDAGEQMGFPADQFVFYRLARIEYHAVAAGDDAGCTTSADFTEEFTDPDPFENQLVIAREADENGFHLYEIATSLSVNHPDGLLTVCEGIGSSTGIFNAEHHLSDGATDQLTDLQTFSAEVNIVIRTVSWDLEAVD